MTYSLSLLRRDDNLMTVKLKDEQEFELSVYSLLSYIVWYIFYRHVKKSEHLYTEMYSMMMSKEMKEKLDIKVPVIAVLLLILIHSRFLLFFPAITLVFFSIHFPNIIFPIVSLLISQLHLLCHMHISYQKKQRSKSTFLWRIWVKYSLPSLSCLIPKRR